LSAYKLPESWENAIKGADLLLMQREIPEAVNIEAAKVAKANQAITILDIGGADSHLSDELIQLLDYVSPN